MRNPFAVVASRVARNVRGATVALAPELQRPFVAPHALPGYRAPERMTAVDYETRAARWPLVWVLDIGGYDAVAGRSSGQASFTLSGAHKGHGQTRLQCQVPLHEGRLFDKEGTYVVVAIPADSEDRVREILSLAGR